MCFSRGTFISHFGQFIYICDLDELCQHFRVERIPSSGLFLDIKGDENKRYVFKSKELGIEYRVYNSIIVDQFCLDVVEHWNYLEGSLETIMWDKVIRREEVNFANK